MPNFPGFPQHPLQNEKELALSKHERKFTFSVIVTKSTRAISVEGTELVFLV